MVKKAFGFSSDSSFKMKASLIEYCSFFYIFCVCCSAQKVLIARKAIESILKKYHVNKTVDLISFGIESERFSNDLLRLNGGAVVIRNKKKSNTLNASSVLLFDSPHNFKEFTLNMTWQGHKEKRFKHIVHIHRATISDIDNGNGHNGFHIDNVNFLVNESEESIELATAFMFSNASCRHKEFKIINRFNRKLNNWENSTFYPNKYRNLHNCTLAMASPEEKWTTGTEIASIIYEELSGNMNYQLNQAFLTSAIFQKVVHGIHSFEQFDILDLERINGYKAPYILSVTMLTERGTLTVPPGESYTPLERMMLPFQDELWIAIIITLSLGFIIIQVINRSPEYMRRFIFGRIVETPTMNLAANFLIGSQYKLPGRNFARFLLMLFILWCLIIRTCYQSELFKCLQRDLRKPRFKVFQELIDNNFTWYHPFEPGEGKFIDDPFYNRYEYVFSLKNYCFESFRSRMAEVSYEVICEKLEGGNCDIQDYLAEPSHKATMLMTPESLSEIYNRRLRSGAGSISLLDETIRTFFRCVAFRPFDPYYEIFNEKIDELISSGIIPHYFWISGFLRSRGKVSEAAGPQVLTMEHLEIGFIICLTPLIVSIAVFLAEIVFHGFLSRFRNR